MAGPVTQQRSLCGTVTEPHRIYFCAETFALGTVVADTTDGGLNVV